METSGTRQVVDGRLPDSCQSLLIKSVIEMSREAAKQKKKKQRKTKEKERLEKPLDQIKYLPGRTAHSRGRGGGTPAFNRKFCGLIMQKAAVAESDHHRARPDQAGPSRAKSSKEPRHKNQTRNS